MPLPLLYQDECLVAINKPSGLLVHRSLIDKHETQFAVQLLRDQIGQKVYPVHRLDRPTSGVLLFALDPYTARLLTAQFTQGLVQKTYLALVRGFCAATGVIDYALKEELDPLADAKADPHKLPQTALTYYRTREQFELPFASGKHASSRYSLLELQPKTGRKHQLRRHLKHIFHPILGDTTHGDGQQNKLFREHFSCERLMLHAQALQVQHPMGVKQTLDLTAPIPAEFETILSQISQIALKPAH